MAHADEYLKITSTTTYTIDAESGTVHVVAEVSLRNIDGCAGNYYYYTGFFLPIPIGTSPALATTQGQSLNVATEPIAGTDDYLLLDITLAQSLGCQQATNVTVTYDLLGNAPRSENPSRINSAYAGFLAFGVGDTATIRVVVPSSFTSETFGDGIAKTSENGDTVYTAADITNANEFEFFVSASRNDALVESDVTTDAGLEFVVRSWPGDTEWHTFMTEQIETGVPVLVDLIGQSWPIDEPVDVRESYTPYLYGYAGWFSAGTNELEIGEELDADTALHELSHAWFNDAWFTDRWLSEGFAQVYASKGVEELGGDGLQPLQVLSDHPGKVLLNEWSNPNFDPAEDINDTEEYGYNASFYVVQQMADEIGDELMREVLAAVANDKTAYQGEVSPESSASTTDWRRFLDLVENIGGSKKAAELFAAYIVTTAQQTMLEERAAARDKYRDLVAHGDEWAAPVVIRERMAAWNFSEATELITAAQAVLDLRDQLDAKAAELATTYPEDLQMGYEAADEDLADAEAAVQEQIATADALLAAVAADAEDDDLFDSIGLIGTDLAKTLDEAKAAFAAGDHEEARDLAQDVIDHVNDSAGAGQLRAVIALGTLLLIALGTTMLIRHRRKQTAASAPASTLYVDGLSDANQPE